MQAKIRKYPFQKNPFHAIGIFILMAVVIYALNFMPENRSTEIVANMVGKFNTVVDAQDREATIGMLDYHLASDVKVTLDTEFSLLQQDPNAKPIRQTFDKAQFMQFARNKLAGFPAFGGAFELGGGFRTDDSTHGPAATFGVRFLGHHWADGNRLIPGTSKAMRYNSDMNCDVALSSQRAADDLRIHYIYCRMLVRMMPRIDSQDFNHLQDKLNEYRLKK